MNVVLLGATGMLGRAMLGCLETRGASIVCLDRHQLDRSRPDSVDAALPAAFEVLIDCAAWTDVDGAETHEAEATRINGETPGALAQACRKRSATLLEFGTDYVFDGHGTRPYRIDDPRAPQNAYGRSKAVGERLVESSGAEFLYVRTSWLYAPWGKNFVRTIAKLARERDQLSIVNDQRGRPTSAEHLARTSLSLLDAGARGFAHVSDAGECTWYELARAVVARVQPRVRVDPCSSDAFPRPATRPAYSVLDLSHTERIVGTLPDWHDNVNDVLDRLEPLDG